MARQISNLSLYQRRLLLFIFSFYAASFVFFFILSLFTFPEKFFLVSFRLEWTLNNCLSLFIKTVIPVHCTAILLSYSFGSVPIHTNRRTNVNSTEVSEAFVSLIKTNLVLFLSLTAVFTITLIGIKPRLDRNIDTQRYRTEMARDFLAKAQDLKTDGNFKLSRSYLEFYLTIDPNNTHAIRLLDQVQKSFYATDLPEVGGEASQYGPFNLLDRDPSELLAIAQEYMEKEDYFSAYYYAALAYEVAEDNGEEWRDAKRFASSAWEKLSSIEPDQEQREVAELFDMKKRGLEALTTEDKNKKIEAYYIFKSLSRSHPEDSEVVRYLDVSIQAIESITYFLPDAEEMITMPGSLNILFVNEVDTEQRELIFIRKMVRSDAGTYVRHVESLAFASGGNLIYHMKAPYAQLIGHDLILLGIDPDDPNRAALPEYIVGEKPEPTPFIIRIKPSEKELIALSKNQTSPVDIGLLDLWSMSEILSKYGHRNEPAQLESMTVIIYPFSFFILSFFSAALGWALKPRKGIPPIFTLIFIPGIPFVLHFILELYHYLHRILIGALLLATNFTVSLTITIVEQAILLLLSVIFLAGKATGRKNDPLQQEI